MSNKYFDIHSITETPKAQVEGVFSKYLNKHLQRIENVSELCRIPDDGEVFFLKTEKAFNAFTFIPWIAKKFFIEEIYASTYSISRRVVEALQELQQDGKVDSSTHRQPVYLQGSAKVRYPSSGKHHAGGTH